MLRRLRHPNVITLHGAVDTPRTIVVALEYASAGDLASYLHAKRREARSHNSAATNALVPTLQNMLERFVACFECKVPEHACTGQRRLAEQAS